MTPEMVHRFWALVDEISQADLCARQDDDLARLLLRACQQRHPLSNVDVAALNSYISTRIPLIRDIALG